MYVHNFVCFDCFIWSSSPDCPHIGLGILFKPNHDRRVSIGRPLRGHSEIESQIISSPCRSWRHESRPDFLIRAREAEFRKPHIHTYIHTQERDQKPRRNVLFGDSLVGNPDLSSAESDRWVQGLPRMSNMTCRQLCSLFAMKSSCMQKPRDAQTRCDMLVVIWKACNFKVSYYQKSLLDSEVNSISFSDNSAY